MSRLPVRREYVTSSDGTKLAVTVTVTGDGPPLVVGPGSLATARDWPMVARALAPVMTTYALDRRGHGSSGDHPAYSLDREQDDLAAVIELAAAAQPDGVTLLGHSYGGLIALALTRRLEGAALEPARLAAASRELARVLADVTVAELTGQAHDDHVLAAATVAGQITRFVYRA